MVIFVIVSISQRIFSYYDLITELNDDREMEYVNFMSPFGQYPVQPTSPSADLAMDMGTDPTKVQVMRASFFGAIDDETDEFETKSGIFLREFIQCASKIVYFY